MVGIEVNCNNNAEDLSICGILGLKVACAHLFFSFTLNGVKYPCALVHWYSRTTDMPSDLTGISTSNSLDAEAT